MIDRACGSIVGQQSRFYLSSVGGHGRTRFSHILHALILPRGAENSVEVPIR